MLDLQPGDAELGGGVSGSSDPQGGSDHPHDADAELGLRPLTGIHISDSLTPNFLRLKRSLLGRLHDRFRLLDLLHELGRLRWRNLLAEAEVGSLIVEHLLEMPPLPLTTGLGLHGLELGGLLSRFGLLLGLTLFIGQTLNWGRDIRRTGEPGHAVTTEHGLGLRVITRYIPPTEET